MDGSVSVGSKVKQAEAVSKFTGFGMRYSTIFTNFGVNDYDHTFIYIYRGLVL